MAVGFVSQSIIACAMFITYVTLGNQLTAAKVFSSLALLAVLQRSVARHFPPALQKLREAKKAVEKIQVIVVIFKGCFGMYICKSLFHAINNHISSSVGSCKLFGTQIFE